VLKYWGKWSPADDCSSCLLVQLCELKACSLSWVEREEWESEGHSGWDGEKHDLACTAMLR